QAGVSQRRRRAWILSSFTIKPDRDIYVATAIAAHGSITGDWTGTRNGCDLVRLAAILRIAHKWIVVWIRCPIDGWSQIEIPEVGSARHTANSGYVAVTELVAANTRLNVLADVGCPRRVVRAEDHATVDICGRYCYSSTVLAADDGVASCWGKAVRHIIRCYE